MKDFNVEGVGRAGREDGEGGEEGEKICRRCLCQPQALFSLSITSIVRYREAGEKREVGIHAEFPVFVVAAALFFPCVPGRSGAIKSHLFGLQIAAAVWKVDNFLRGLDPARFNGYILMPPPTPQLLLLPATPERGSNPPSQSVR